MRFAFVSLLLFVACGDSETSSQHTALFGQSVASAVRVRALGGSVLVRPGPKLSVHSSTRSGDVAAIESAVADGVLTVRNTNADPNWAVDLVVEVPAAAVPVDLDIATRDAPVRVEGAWGNLVVKTMSGDITANVASIAGGQLQSAKGTIVVRAAAEAPTDDLKCASTDGDVSITVPATFRGSIQATAKTKELLDVPPHKKLRFLDDSTRTNRRGWFGQPYTPQDRADAGAMWKDPPGIWARSQLGRAAIAFVD